MENPVRFAPVWGGLVRRRPASHFEPSRSHCLVWQNPLLHSTPATDSPCIARSASRMGRAERRLPHLRLLWVTFRGAARPFSPDEQRYTERRSFGSDSRNCVGERRTIRLNARLKFVMDWNPQAKATSLIRELGLSKRVFDFSTRTLARWSMKLIPVAFLNILQK